jgi:transmembrane 9 superfamily protein 2/4
MIGSYFGHKHDIVIPVNTSETQSDIPDMNCWYKRPLFVFPMHVFVRYSTICVASYLVMTSMWLGDGYLSFGFIMATFILAMSNSLVISIIQNFADLHHGNYHWWWRSFFFGASMGVFYGIYALSFVRKLHANYFMTYIIYFGVSGLISLTIALMAGAISVLGCLWFNLKIFSRIEV